MAFAKTRTSCIRSAVCTALLAFPLGCLAAADDATFQPSAPYHAAFFYPWYPDWSDRGHTPPANWFSNYLPDPNPCVFDPADELYRSTDDRIIYWQLRKMAEARIEVAISSWWGRGHKTDVALRRILTDVMGRADNPYPNLRWAVYYELESQGDPTVEQLTADLEYIRENYAVRPAYLKVGGRPVVFVYAEGRDTSGMAARWAEARGRTGFYTVLKVYPGYRNDPNQPDSWHQYAPANRIDRQGPYSWAVSPGFWLDGEGVRLPRDLDAFGQAVSVMVAADVTWKLIETWNEWGEGTSVEPGEPVIQTKSGQAEPDPDGPPFKNLYVEALGELLPPLERGTGAADIRPSFERAGVVNGASFAAGPVTPNQSLTVFGARLAADGEDVRVLFDCQEAQISYAGPEQINVVVPERVAGRRHTELRIERGGEISATVTLAVAEAAPGIFTSDGSGRGQAVVMNQDGSWNSSRSPAARGSVVTVFATGVGSGRVSVRIGGVEAAVEGVEPTSSPAVTSIRARVPGQAAPAAELPVVLNCGEAESQPGVTIAVQ